MSKIKCVAPFGFNIKTKKGIIFSGEKLFPPFNEDTVFDMKENPHRWDIEYEDEKIEDEKIPELEKPVVKKSAAAVEKTAQVKAKRKKITTK